MEDPVDTVTLPRLSCPHCPDAATFGDPALLRLHLFRHYSDFWRERIVQMEVRDSGDRVCRDCRTKIRGATAEGTWQAAVCHFAIQHDELRSAVDQDPRLTEPFRSSFVRSLYRDLDDPASSKTKENSYFRAFKAMIGSMTAMPSRSKTSAEGSGTPPAKKPKTAPSQLPSKIRTQGQSLPPPSVAKPNKTSKTSRLKSGQPLRSIPGTENKHYIRKR